MQVFRTTTAADLESVQELLARVRGRSPASSCRSAGLPRDWLDCSIVAARPSGAPIGFLGARVRPEQGRALLHGPFIDLPMRHPAAAAVWDRVADGMLRRIRLLPPLAQCRDVELFGYVDHRLLVTFAARNGFAAEPRTRTLWLDHAHLRELLLRAVPSGDTRPGYAVVDADPGTAHWPAVLDLHRRLARSTPPDLAASPAGERTVLAAIRPADDDAGSDHPAESVCGRVLGYVAGAAGAHEYTVHAVGVHAEWRRQGLGRALVTALIRELAWHNGPRAGARASADPDDVAAEGLLAALSFRSTAEVTPYHAAW